MEEEEEESEDEDEAERRRQRLRAKAAERVEVTAEIDEQPMVEIMPRVSESEDSSSEYESRLGVTVHTPPHVLSVVNQRMMPCSWQSQCSSPSELRVPPT